MTIAKKLLMAVGLTGVITLICILIPLVAVKGLDGVRKDLATSDLLDEKVSLSQELQLQVANVWQFFTDASLTRSEEVIQKEAKPAYDQAMKVATRLQELAGSDAAQATKIKGIKEALPPMWQTGMAMVAAYGRSHAEGNRAMEDYDKACNAASKGAAEITEKVRQEARSQMGGVQKGLTIVTRSLSLGGGAAAIIGIAVIVLMLVMRRSIVTALRRVLAEVVHLSKGEGDLTHQLEIRSQDEIGQLGANINGLISKLRELIGSLYDEGGHIAIKVCHMSITTQTTVAAALKQKEEAFAVAVAADQMAATLNGVAQNTHQAAGAASSVNQAAAIGMNAVKDACDCMEGIRESVEATQGVVERLAASSVQIGEIARQIEDIADQTNLLALNAAIEAARAGDHGRGFAVVADEVKNLSSKTAACTRDISTIIAAIQQESNQAVQAMDEERARVGDGVTTALAAREALDKIFGLAAESTDMVNQIATATEEQSATTSEITSNVQKISASAQDVNDQMQKTETTLRHLADVAEQIYATVGRFSVGNYHDRMKGLACELRDRAGEALEAAVARGDISLDQLFARHYTPIPNTHPQKYTTPFDALFDRIISPLQESILAKDGDVVFAICVDERGYVASHNLKYSQRLTGNPEVDKVHNRTKRIFDDKTGLRAAQNSTSFLLQTYSRDTGEVMNDLSTSIFVKGKRWGAVRIGYRARE